MYVVAVQDFNQHATKKRPMSGTQRWDGQEKQIGPIRVKIKDKLTQEQPASLNANISIEPQRNIMSPQKKDNYFQLWAA